MVCFPWVTWWKEPDFGHALFRQTPVCSGRRELPALKPGYRISHAFVPFCSAGCGWLIPLWKIIVADSKSSWWKSSWHMLKWHLLIYSLEKWCCLLVLDKLFLAHEKLQPITKYQHSTELLSNLFSVPWNSETRVLLILSHCSGFVGSLD